MYVRAYLELGGHGTEASGDAKDESIEVGELEGCDDGIVGLGGRMHLGQDLLGKSLRNPGFG